MEIIAAKPEEVLVIQYSVREDIVLSLYHKFDYGQFRPLPAVRYEKNGILRGYILTDGHHRASVVCLNGFDIPLKIEDNDQRFRKNIRNPKHHFHTMEKFIAYYESFWKPANRLYGILSINDLVRINGLEELAISLTKAN